MADAPPAATSAATTAASRAIRRAGRWPRSEERDIRGSLLGDSADGAAPRSSLQTLVRGIKCRSLLPSQCKIPAKPPFEGSSFTLLRERYTVPHALGLA